LIDETSYEEKHLEAIVPLDEELPDVIFSDEKTWYVYV